MGRCSFDPVLSSKSANMRVSDVVSFTGDAVAQPIARHNRHSYQAERDRLFIYRVRVQRATDGKVAGRYYESTARTGQRVGPNSPRIGLFSENAHRAGEWSG
jgi:hypothetical protein